MNQNLAIVGITVAGLVGCQQPSSPAAETAPTEPAASKPSSRPQSAARGAASKPSSRPKSTLTAVSGLKIGDAAPLTGHSMTGVGGASASIASVQKDKGVLVIFTCNHCPWVKAWQDRTVQAANGFLEQGVGVIAVNSNDPAAYEEDRLDGMEARARAAGMKYPYVVDPGSKLARAFGADKTPEFFLFDADMKLVYHGAIDDSAHEPDKVSKTFLKDAVEALVSGQPIPQPQSKALGCGIKFYDNAS